MNRGENPQQQRKLAAFGPAEKKSAVTGVGAPS